MACPDAVDIPIIKGQQDAANMNELKPVEPMMQPDRGQPVIEPVDAPIAEPRQGLRLGFSDLQDIQSEANMERAARLGQPQGINDVAGLNEPDALSPEEEFLGGLLFGWIGVIIQGGVMLYQFVDQENLKGDFRKDYVTALRNTFLKRDVFVYVMTPDDPSKTFKWWEGKVQSLTINESDMTISTYTVKYHINSGKSYEVVIDDVSNIMLNQGYRPQNTRKYMYARDQQALKNLDLTFDMYDNWIPTSERMTFKRGDPVKSSMWDGTRAIQSVNHDGTYTISGINENVYAYQIEPSTEAAIEVDSGVSADFLANAFGSPEPLPGFNIVFLRHTDPFSFKLGDQVISHPSGFVQMVLREQEEMLYFRVQNDFEPIYTLGDMPLPYFIQL